MRADRRKNGRLQKYHYSKIQNAGDCVARTGVREIGFKFGSLPHDPGGITCMMVKYLFVIFYLCIVMFLNLGHQLAKGETCGDGRRQNARYMNANKT